MEKANRIFLDLRSNRLSAAQTCHNSDYTRNEHRQGTDGCARIKTLRMVYECHKVLAWRDKEASDGIVGSIEPGVVTINQHPPAGIVSVTGDQKTRRIARCANFHARVA